MMAGVIRIGFMVNNSDGVLIPRGHCMFQMYQTAQMTGQLGSCTTVLIVAIDRLLAVAIFDQYRHFKKRYACNSAAKML
uniref:Uncharacterized protein n=1 Tax=Romanomermis culicivorax TaxID=13658 RepID=A0A915IND6_ROMCU